MDWVCPASPLTLLVCSYPYTLKLPFTPSPSPSLPPFIPFSFSSVSPVRLRCTTHYLVPWAWFKVSDSFPERGATTSLAPTRTRRPPVTSSFFYREPKTRERKELQR
eukprot:scaffold63268_cov34-Tisochrysis_lutea.AAC.1